MQEHFKKNINFGQSQWLNRDLSAQRGSVKSDPQKGGDNTFI